MVQIYNIDGMITVPGFVSAAMTPGSLLCLVTPGGAVHSRIIKDTFYIGFAFDSELLELPPEGGLDRLSLLLLVLLEPFSMAPGALSLSLSLSSFGSSGRKWPTTFVAPCDGQYEKRGLQ